MDKKIALFENNTKLAYYFAKSYLISVPPQYHEDLYSEAKVGLWKACLKFDDSRGTKFSTYAVRAIKSQLNMFMRTYRRSKFINDARSFDETIENCESVVLEDTVGYEIDFDSELIGKELIQRVSRYKLLNLAYLKGMSQCEISNQLGVSQSYISRLLKKQRQKLLKEISI